MRTAESKILDREAMRREAERLRALGRALVFTNGCFDLLHAGHAQYLAFARGQGDALLIGLNTDASVRRAKGSARPVVPERERALLLASLECVDYVVLFDEAEPAALIREVTPAVLVKGEDWAHYVSGRDWVEAQGGRVVLAPLVKGLSTTRLIERIREAHGGPPPGESSCPKSS
jgi:D-beta-D-heptose 7-phosphate kinase/D-beta-D-heptose 1-phosphate adenosyltransferase